MFNRCVKSTFVETAMLFSFHSFTLEKKNLSVNVNSRENIRIKNDRYILFSDKNNNDI
jgi:hypothetical protein